MEIHDIPGWLKVLAGVSLLLNLIQWRRPRNEYSERRIWVLGLCGKEIFRLNRVKERTSLKDSNPVAKITDDQLPTS